MDPYEKEIKEINPSFYEAIIPYISSMPVFQPEETRKRWKKEPQNNWKLLFEDLHNIGYHKDHLNILSYINEENIESILLYADDRQTVESVAISYEALVWAMFQVSSMDTLAALFIPHHLFLDDIIFKTSYISYMRSSETVDYFYYKLLDENPDFILNLVLPLELLDIGHIYWKFTMGDIYEYKKSSFYRDKMIDMVISSEDKQLIDLTLKYLDSYMDDYLQKAIEFRLTKIIEYLIPKYTFPPPQFYYDLMIKSSEKGYADIVPFLLKYMKEEDFMGKEDYGPGEYDNKSYDLYVASLIGYNPESTEYLLKDGRIIPYITDFWQIFYKRMDKYHPNVLALLLKYNLLNIKTVNWNGSTDNYIKDIVIKRNQKTVLEAIGLYTNLLKEKDYTKSAIEYRNSSAVNIILDARNGMIDEPEKMVRMAFSLKEREILSSLLVYEEILSTIPKGLLKRIEEYIHRV